MTFKEYLEQEDPKRMPKVFVNDQDVFTKVVNGLNTHIILRIHGKYFTYLHGDHDRLFTVDEDGNKKAMSCFIYIGDKQVCTKCKGTGNIRPLTPMVLRSRKCITCKATGLIPLK